MRTYTSRYVRNSAGRTIHLSSCYRMGAHARPWLWAEGKPRKYLADLCEGFGYKTCKRCDPFEEDK